MFIDIIISSLVTMQQFLKYNSSVIYGSLQTRALLITSHTSHLAGDQLHLWVYPSQCSDDTPGWLCFLQHYFWE